MALFKNQGPLTRTCGVLPPPAAYTQTPKGKRSYPSGSAANLSRYTFCSFIAEEMNVRRKVKTPEDNHVCAPGI